MVNVTVSGGNAVFELEGSHKLWAVKSRVEVPTAHITGVHADANPAMGWFDGLKVMGTAIPHVFRAGTFWMDGDLVFFDVRHPEKTIVIDLEHEHFARLIVEVTHPEETVKMLQEHLSSR